MTCEEFTKFLDEYVEGRVPADKAATFEHHLSICQACVDYLASYRATIQLSKLAFEDAAEDLAEAEEVPEALVQAVLSARRK